MKKYETEKQPKIYYLLFAIFILIGIGLFGYSVYFLIFYFSISMFFLWPFFSGIGILMVITGLSWIEASMAVYKFKPEGLVAIFPIKKEIMIPWNDFEEICVCHVWVGNIADNSKPKPIICFARKGEKRNGSLRWKTENPFKCYRVFTIPYTIEYYEGLKERCPYDIPDLRNTLRYKYR